MWRNRYTLENLETVFNFQFYLYLSIIKQLLLCFIFLFFSYRDALLSVFCLFFRLISSLNALKKRQNPSQNSYQKLYQ